MKNQKKFKKVLLILIIVLLIFSYNIVFASDLTNGIEISNRTVNQFEDIGNEILGVVKVIGIIASVIALSLIGIKYMISSVEEKAEYKKTFLVYIIGAVLVFGLSTFAETVYDLIDSIL